MPLGSTCMYSFVFDSLVQGFKFVQEISDRRSCLFGSLTGFFNKASLVPRPAPYLVARRTVLQAMRLDRGLGMRLQCCRKSLFQDIDEFRSIFSLWQLEGKGSCDVHIDQSAGSMVM